MYFRHQLSNSVVDVTISVQKLLFSETFNEKEKTNCQNDSTVQCNNATTDKWKEKKKIMKKKYWWEVDKGREDEKDDWKKIKKENEFKYDNVQERQRKEFKYAKIYNISH